MKQKGLANWDIYDDFKLKKITFGLRGLYKNILASWGVNNVKC